MKVLAINGSSRKESNTQILIDVVLDELKTEGIETESVALAGQVIRGCTACRMCQQNKDNQCVIKKDIVNELVAKMVEADGIIIGSPVYFSDVTSETKAIIDRCGYVVRANGNLLKRKIGASVAVARRTGAMPTLHTIDNFFLISGMYLVGSTYWNMAEGKAYGDVNEDTEGIDTMKNLAQNMAWILKRVKGKG